MAIRLPGAKREMPKPRRGYDFCYWVLSPLFGSFGNVYTYRTGWRVNMETLSYKEPVTQYACVCNVLDSRWHLLIVGIVALLVIAVALL